MKKQMRAKNVKHRKFGLSKMWLIAPAIGALFVAVGCNNDAKGPKGPDKADILVQIGDSVLLKSAVVHQIPSGLSKQDSTLLFDAIVENWIEKRLLVDVAEINLPSLERIDKMVEDYRTQLLVNEYRRVMAASNSGIVSDDSIEAYYNSHKEQMLLTAPLVKGIYIKVPSNAEQLSEIRKWVQSAKADDIDQLEKYGLKGAMQYDYFVDTWIAWQSVADLIPHRFADPETFLKPGYIFDTSYDGSEYLLHITDVLHTGTQMPLEYARDEITEALTDSRRESYDNNLLRSLYRKAVTDKKLKVSGYVPQKFR